MSEEPRTRSEPRARQRRGVKRRQELLEATRRVLAREGAAAVTMRAVAAEAGVPVTATTYYFNSKRELLREAWKLHAESEEARVSTAIDAIASVTSPDGIGTQLARFVHDGLGLGREPLLAEIELLLEAARQPELEQLTRVWHQATRQHVERMLPKAGTRQPGLDARLLLAVTAGLELDNLGSAAATTWQELHSLFTRLLSALCQ